MSIKNLLEINSYKVFLISIIICILFYYFERLIGIDQFYHPDTLYYLNSEEKYYYFKSMFSERPLAILNNGFLFVLKIFNHNYHQLIIFNFVIFSLTNLIVYNLVFKDNLLSFNKFQIFILYTILFFDPYRLHLVGHILKETLLIFLILSFLYFKNLYVKMIFIFLGVFIKKNIIFYFFIFYIDDLIQKFFKIKKKLILPISVLIIICLFLFFFKFTIFDQEKSIFSYFTLLPNQSFIETLEIWHYRSMGGRDYDNVPNFQNISFPLALIYKIIIWPSLIISGFFLFFTNSFLFKILGLLMIYFNVGIYYLTKKSFMNIGLLILLILIALYSVTFTSYFRYSYVAIYCSIVFFFSNLYKCQKK